MAHETIESLNKEIELLTYFKESEELLEQIWLELGPYTNHLIPELGIRLQKHFNFDDSE